MKVTGYFSALIVAVSAMTVGSAATANTSQNLSVLWDGGGYFGQSNLSAGSFANSYVLTVDKTAVYDVIAHTYSNTSFAASLNGSPLLRRAWGPRTYDEKTVSGSFVLDKGQTYTLTVTGQSTNALNYNGSVVAAPVPEPETIAMLLAGLGVIGVVTRRRNGRTPAV